MLDKRGEISTVVVVGTFAVIGVAMLFANMTQQRNVIQTRAAGICRDNPVAPPDGYRWTAQCDEGHACTSNSQCEIGANNQEGWCYGFESPGWRCMRLDQAQSGGIAPAPNTDGPGGLCSPYRGSADSRGCGGADGCRVWESCQNGTCIWQNVPINIQCGQVSNISLSIPQQQTSPVVVAQNTATPTPTPTNTPSPRITLSSSQSARLIPTSALSPVPPPRQLKQCINCGIVSQSVQDARRGKIIKLVKQIRSRACPQTLTVRDYGCIYLPMVYEQ